MEETGPYRIKQEHLEETGASGGNWSTWNKTLNPQTSAVLPCVAPCSSLIGPVMEEADGGRRSRRSSGQQPPPQSDQAVNCSNIPP
uniref:Uncharacterized protein n=1 Tax=Knipowitschia caucasica TaxID=637954 RepID=A0AAV2IUJ0_KNICA